jgi:hypothetical protein
LTHYPTGAQWTDRLPAAAFFNGPVVDIEPGLESAIARPRSLIPR